MVAGMKSIVAVALLSGVVAYLLMGWFGVCDAAIDPIKCLPSLAVPAAVYGFVWFRQRELAATFGVSALIGSLVGIVTGYAAPWVCF